MGVAGRGRAHDLVPGRGGRRRAGRHAGRADGALGSVAGDVPGRVEDGPAGLGVEGERYPGVEGKVVYGEGVLVGYRFYETMRLAPLFPFGFGLSYGDMAFEGVRADGDQVELTVINNGTPDFTPPMVQSGKILTKNVSIGDPNARFRVSVTATDDVSGVEFPIVLVNHDGIYPGGLQVTNPAPQPLQSGTFTAEVPSLFFATALGDWKIVGYGAIDAAGNAFVDDKPADIRATFGDEIFHVVD